MVTWGNNTTAVYGTTTPANAPTTPAPAPNAFSFGGAPSTPPSASQKPAVNPPPLSGFGAPAVPAAPSAGGTGGGFSFGGATTSATAPAPAGGGLFGSTSAAPAPSVGLFGSTTTPAPAPTAGGGLFGSTTTTPAPATFGSAPAPSTSLFGAPSPAAAPSTTNVFGSTQQQQQPAAQQQYQSYNPQQAALQAHQSASQRQEAARIEEAIFNLHSKYSPHASDPLNPALASNNIPSSLCAFTAILYDPLPPEHRITPGAQTRGGGANGGVGLHLSAPKPSHISNQTWNEALARNPDPNELMPTPLVGATSLHSRLVAQQDKSNALQSHATKLRDTLTFLERTGRSSREHIQHLSNTQMELNRRLLEIMRKVEIIRCMNQPTQRAEEESQIVIRKLLEQVNGVMRKLVDLEERGRQQARNWRMRGAVVDKSGYGGNGSVGEPLLSEEDKLALFHVLNDQRLGMERLGSIVTRDVRDTEILKEEMNKAEKAAVGVVRGVAGRPAIFGGR